MLGKVLDSVVLDAASATSSARASSAAPSPARTEIYISHRGMEEVYHHAIVGQGGYDNTVWQPRPPDPELEAEMLRRLMVRLGVAGGAREGACAAVDRRRRARAPDARAASGAGTLDVDEPFDRAWRRVGLALDRVGFTVEDRDRSKGFYFVRYIDPAQDGVKKNDGILSKLAFWRSDDKPAPSRAVPRRRERAESRRDARRGA